MNRHGYASLVLALLCSGAFALTDQERVTEIAKLLPAGKTMRAVWLAHATNTNISIKAMSSTDGKIVTLTSGSVFMPNLTYDGSRIIYVKNESECWAMNWDGSNNKKVGDCGEALRYYRDRTTNTDWAITAQGQRFNIDAPSQTAVVWSGNPGANVMDYTPLSLSYDGKYCGGHFPHPWYGVGQVPNGPIYVEKVFESCYATIAPDNSYDIMVQDGPHTTLYVKSKSGAAVAQYAISTPILTYAAANSLKNSDSQQKFEDARWGNDRNYAITFMWATKANPWFIRLSDLQFTYLDLYTAFPSYYGMGCPDFVVLPEPGISGTKDELTRTARGVSCVDQRDMTGLYSLTGRRVDHAGVGNHGTGVRGVVVRASHDRAQSAPEMVLMR